VRAFQPTVLKSVGGLVLRPAAMVFAWLVFGVLAHASARMLSGTGSLGQTLGATALATAPQLLGAVHVLPYVQATGLGIWSVICAFLALKSAHGLSPGRAFWATLIPLLLIGLVTAAVGAGVAAAFVLSQMQALR
jgi:hypothetical protein